MSDTLKKRIETWMTTPVHMDDTPRLVYDLWDEVERLQVELAAANERAEKVADALESAEAEIQRLGSAFTAYVPHGSGGNAGMALTLRELDRFVDSCKQRTKAAEARCEELEKTLAEIGEFVEDYATAGVVLDDPRLGYVEIQVNPELHAAAKKWVAAAALAQTEEAK